MEQTNQTTEQVNHQDNSEIKVESVVDSQFDKLDKVLKIVGLGGQGGNAAQHVYDKKLPYVSYLVCNTDVQDLNKLTIPEEDKIVIGTTLTRRLGAGGDPANGIAAMKENLNEVKARLTAELQREKDPLKLVFVLAGLGGGTGSGAAQVFTELCKELKVPTVVVLTLPPYDDGEASTKIALTALKEIEQNANAIILIDNDSIYKHFADETETDGFNKIDELEAGAVKSIVEFVCRTPRINIDINDIRSVFMKDFLGTNVAEQQDAQTSPEKEIAKLSIIGTGIAEGEKRVEDAIDAAINSPLLLRNDLTGAATILYQYLTSETTPLKAAEAQNIKKHLMKKAKRLVNFRRGGGTDTDIEDNKLLITIVATDFEESLTPSAVYEQIIKEKREKQEAEYQQLDNEDSAQPTDNTTVAQPVSLPSKEPVKVEKRKNVQIEKEIPLGSVIELPTRIEEEVCKNAAAAMATPRGRLKEGENLFSIQNQENAEQTPDANKRPDESNSLSDSSMSDDINIPAYERILRRK